MIANTLRTETAGDVPRDIAIADPTNDARLDIAVAAFGDAVLCICLGDGVGGFEYPKHYDGLEGSLSAAVGDVNNDGRPDIVTSNPSFGHLVVFRSRSRKADRRRHEPRAARPPRGWIGEGLPMDLEKRSRRVFIG